jgi:hypothetical protein
VTGVKSEFPISQLASKYLDMSRNGQFLSNQHSLEIIRQRIIDLASRIDKEQAPERLATLGKLWAEFKANGGVRGADLDARKAAAMLDAEFESAYHDYAAWQQMFEALDLDRKMVESEVKIAKDLKAILTAKDAYELTAKLLASIIEAATSLIVDDTVRSRFLKRIQYEFARLIGDRGGGEDIEGSGGSRREVFDSVTGVVD